MIKFVTNCGRAGKMGQLLLACSREAGGAD